MIRYMVGLILNLLHYNLECGQNIGNITRRWHVKFDNETLGALGMFSMKIGREQQLHFGGNAH